MLTHDPESACKRSIYKTFDIADVAARDRLFYFIFLQDILSEMQVFIALNTIFIVVSLNIEWLLTLLLYFIIIIEIWILCEWSIQIYLFLIYIWLNLFFYGFFYFDRQVLAILGKLHITIKLCVIFIRWCINLVAHLD